MAGGKETSGPGTGPKGWTGEQWEKFKGGAGIRSKKLKVAAVPTFPKMYFRNEDTGATKEMQFMVQQDESGMTQYYYPNISGHGLESFANLKALGWKPTRSFRPEELKAGSEYNLDS